MPKATAGELGKDTTQAAEQAGVRWDTTQLKNSYCNVANATSTRESVVLNFGVNQNWDRPRAELEVQLLHRIVLSPFAAKQLQQLLTKLIIEYESRHGELR